MKEYIQFTEEEIENSQKNLEKLKKSGILVTRTEFNAAVDAKVGKTDIPEYGFNVNSNTPSRRAKMWLLPGGSLLCEQEGKHIFVPATHKFAHLK